MMEHAVRCTGTTPTLHVVRRNYTYLPNAFFDCGILSSIVHRIGPGAALVWLELFRLSRGAGLATVSTTIKHIRMSTGLADRTIQKSIAMLVREGLIEIELEKSGSPRTYRVVWKF